MATTAIHAEGIGKRYVLGRALDPHRTLREALTESAARAARSAGRLLGRRGAGDDADAFWALRDVSFEVAQGEAIAIIGGNGAGKSTLLKILSRITKPTLGRAEIRGRVGSLLEVGTGFHPELTGRENVFLNGAILGMRRVEIAGKFDEIVAFAEIARFVDTPVKRYSSGMYMRLAFAVAAYLEPEVLLVDEVLAVGDAAFQQKCLGKMSDVTATGRTVLFVSHNMDAVRRLCGRAVLLERGAVAASGRTAEVLDRYLARATDRLHPRTWAPLADARRIGSGEVRFAAVRYAAPDDPAGEVHPGGAVDLDIEIDASAPATVASFAVTFRTLSGVILVNVDTIARGQLLRFERGRTVMRVRLDALHLRAGRYAVALWMSRSGDGEGLDYIETAIHLDVVDRATAGLGMTPIDNGVVPCDFSVAALSHSDEDHT